MTMDRGVARGRRGRRVGRADFDLVLPEDGMTSRDLASAEYPGVVDVVTLSNLGCAWVRNGVLGEREGENERGSVGVLFPASDFKTTGDCEKVTATHNAVPWPNPVKVRTTSGALPVAPTMRLQSVVLYLLLPPLVALSCCIRGASGCTRVLVINLDWLLGQSVDGRDLIWYEYLAAGNPAPGSGAPTGQAGSL
jgi:uncharacterized membrane protein